MGNSFVVVLKDHAVFLVVNFGECDEFMKYLML